MKLDLELRPGANRFVSEAGALAYLDTILPTQSSLLARKVSQPSPRLILAS